MLLSADADLIADTEYGQGSDSRTAQRKGYRHRKFDSCVGMIDNLARTAFGGAGLLVYEGVEGPRPSPCPRVR